MTNISTNLTIFIAICFVIQLLYSPTFQLMFQLSPNLAILQPWRFVSSMFLHDPIDFIHILLNSYALIMFGSILERQISRKDYLVIFFGAGILGGILYWLTYVLGLIGPLPAIGASGAIYGLMGALAILLPDLTIFLWFIPIKMRYAAILWFFLELVGILQTSVSGIASAGHLGGLIFGVLYAYFAIKGRPRVVQMPQFNQNQYYQPPKPAW
ncbi:MAG: rhomboid family intramembrane serine protease [Candidatus Bilamarchaeum sp.]|jgi:membrane associated rhomboid family serine protease